LLNNIGNDRDDMINANETDMIEKKEKLMQDTLMLGKTATILESRTK